MSYTENINTLTIAPRQQSAQEATVEDPTVLELFSYGLCCIAQGTVWVLYLGLVVFVPLALRQGLF